MKISPKIYAKSLVDSSEGNDLKNIASKFWHILQKNKQYRDFGKVLNEIDAVAAENENKILVKIYAKNEPNETELAELKKKINQRIILSANEESRSFADAQDDRVILKYFPSNITGIIIKADDKIIDLSLENKINRLGKILNPNI